MLVVSLLLFVAFAFYINKASNPFITPAFFKNTRWLRAICLILVFYFVNYALSPIFNAIGTNIYGMTTTRSPCTLCGPSWSPPWWAPAPA